MKIKLGKTEIIHFIGIGGIGMSGLAIIMSGLGFKIQGSDISLNKNIDRLKKNKIKVFHGHKKNNITSSTIIVISSAIKINNPEYLEAKKRKLPIYKRGDMLGHIVSLMKNVVVAGSHGKTTTTSIISAIFAEARIDPTIINGGILNSYGNSAKLGKSDWCVLESDESDGSFLKIPVTYSVVTNIDFEHIDYYQTINKLKKSFIKFINKTPSFGKCFICLDDKINKSLLRYINNKNYITYGVNNSSNFRVKNIRQKVNYTKFDVSIRLPGNKQDAILNIKIPLIGIHNILNSTAALAVSYSLGISKKIIKSGLKKFKGVQRRFNHIFSYKKVDYFDDYAHHPTEINAVLNSIKSAYKKKDIFCIFQPHRISRVNLLRKEFSKCFSYANTVILCPIYKAGETIKLKFNYENFAKEIIKNSNVRLILVKNENELYKFIKQSIFGNKIVVAVGAGSISNWIGDMPPKLL